MSLAALVACGAGCFHDLDPRVVLGAQGYVPRPVLVFPEWRAHLTTSNEYWDYKPLEYAAAAASDSGDRVFAGSREGVVTCFDVRSGKVVWTFKVGREVRSRLTYHEGTLYFGAADGRFYALDAEKGEVRWKHNGKAEVTSPPAISSERIYFTSTDHTVYAVDAESGEWKWHYTRPVPEGFSIQGQSGPLLYQGSVYVGFADGYLVSLKAEDGALQWEKKLSEAARFGDVDTTPVIGGGAVIAGAFNEGLYAVDPADGIIKWKIPLVGASTPAIAGDVGYATTPKGEVVSFRVADGKVLWRAQTDGGYLSEPVRHHRWLLFAQSEITRLKTRGGVWILDRDTGAVETVIDVGYGVRGRPVTTKSRLFFLTDSGWFHAYRFGRGSAR